MVVIPVSYSFRHEETITSVGGALLFGPGRFTTMSAGSSTGGSGGALNLTFWTTIGGSASVIDGRGRSDRKGCVSCPSDIRHSADSGSVAKSSAGTDGNYLRHTDLSKQDTRRCGPLVISYRDRQWLRIHSISLIYLPVDTAFVLLLNVS